MVTSWWTPCHLSQRSKPRVTDYFRLALEGLGKRESGVTFFTRSVTASIPVCIPSLTDCIKPGAFLLPALDLVELFLAAGLATAFTFAVAFLAAGFTLAAAFFVVDLTALMDFWVLEGIAQVVLGLGKEAKGEIDQLGCTASLMASP